jgi:YfiH family protein
MIAIIKNKIPLLQFSNLSGFPGLLHFVTTREGGVSTGHYSSFNLGFNSGDNPESVSQNRTILSKTLNLESDHLIFPKQTHSATVKVIDHYYLEADKHEQKDFLMETDALITNIKRIYLGIKTADCVPMLLFDRKSKVIAAVHAGWKGTLKGIAFQTVKRMISEFNSDPSYIVAGIGPSISPGAYEVGQEVWSQFDPEYIHPYGNVSCNKRLLDLWKANHDQLYQTGIPADQIELAGLCTYSNPESFFSARRDGAKTGRMATGIMML